MDAGEVDFPFQDQPGADGRWQPNRARHGGVPVGDAEVNQRRGDELPAVGISGDELVDQDQHVPLSLAIEHLRQHLVGQDVQQRRLVRDRRVAQQPQPLQDHHHPRVRGKVKESRQVGLKVEGIVFADESCHYLPEHLAGQVGPFVQAEVAQFVQFLHHVAPAQVAQRAPVHRIGLRDTVDLNVGQ